MNPGIPNPFLYEPKQQVKSEIILRYAEANHLKPGPNWLRGTDFAAAIQYGGAENRFAELLLFDSFSSKFHELLLRLSNFPPTIVIPGSKQQFLMDLGLNELIAMDSVADTSKLEPVQIRKFIERMRTTRSVQLMTADQESLWSDAHDTYEWLGEELIELLEKKLKDAQ